MIKQQPADASTILFFLEVNSEGCLNLIYQSDIHMKSPRKVLFTCVVITAPERKSLSGQKNKPCTKRPDGFLGGENVFSSYSAIYNSMASLHHTLKPFWGRNIKKILIFDNISLSEQVSPEFHCVILFMAQTFYPTRVFQKGVC